jgi:3-phosphoshikimate 1-carboxyvinyltransferase
MEEVIVKKSVLRGLINCPPSKSYSHRAVVVSSLAEGESLLTNPLRSRDTNATIIGCKALGVGIKDGPKHIVISGRNRFSAPNDVINVENSGTTLRFLTPMSALVDKGYTVITGDESIRRRPMGPLLRALNNVGVKCYSTRLNGSAPIIVKGGGIRGGNTTLCGTVSSQFLSGILISGIYAQSELEIQIEGRQVSRPYIDSTIAIMKEFGIRIEKSSDYSFFSVREGRYKPTSFNIPGDFSAAALMLSAGAMLAEELIVSGLDFSFPQGDSKIVEFLERLGAKIKKKIGNGQLSVSSCESFDGGEFDLSDTPDLLPAISILSLKSRKPIRIFGISHARFKETDRLGIIASELSKLGLEIKVKNDELLLNKTGELKSACLDAHNDHRLFMSFVIAAMLTDGSVIRGAESVDVSYPKFLTDMKKLGGNIDPYR